MELLVFIILYNLIKNRRTIRLETGRVEKSFLNHTHVRHHAGVTLILPLIPITTSMIAMSVIRLETPQNPKTPAL